MLLKAIRKDYPVREAPPKDTAYSNGILPKSVSSPPPPSIKQTDALWQVFFAENEQILKHSVLYFGNEYLDNNYGQT